MRRVVQQADHRPGEAVMLPGVSLGGQTAYCSRTARLPARMPDTTAAGASPGSELKSASQIQEVSGCLPAQSFSPSIICFGCPSASTARSTSVNPLAFLASTRYTSCPPTARRSIRNEPGVQRPTARMADPGMPQPTPPAAAPTPLYPFYPPQPGTPPPP